MMPTSRAKIKARGFTLVELLVVVAIIGLITAFALPTVSSVFKMSLNKTAREVASIVKETYNSAVITGRVHRIAYDLEKGDYWVESGPNTVLLDTSESLEKEKRRKRFAKESDQGPPSEFGLEKSVTRKKLSLPSGVKFEDVVTEQSFDPIVKGTAYTHFFPHGITEQTLIHLVDSENHHISLSVSMLVGQTKLIEGHATEEEIFGRRQKK